MLLTGAMLQKLMRKHGVTIRELANRMGLAMTRVRHYREHGVTMPARLDWEQAIIGEFTPRHKAMLAQWRKQPL